MYIEYTENEHIFISRKYRMYVGSFPLEKHKNINLIMKRDWINIYQF